ncbi:rab GTPase-binding effector protein 2-like, partial [Hyperolius riggenbachi]|uniref:rab GTPase-binding effector protein 2-like n=1 Tax=Hyperolius riggenbachi TaxID=752182 RepID=UPI0035A2E207
VAQQTTALKTTRERLDRVTLEKESLQDALRCSAEDCANQVKQLLEQIKNSEDILQNLQRSLSDTQQKTSREMAALTASFSRLCQEVNCLKEENEKLRSLSSEPPPSGQGEQLSSQQRVEKHRQERLCIEIVSLQEELKAEQVAKNDLEEQLRRQTDSQTEEREIVEEDRSCYLSVLVTMALCSLLSPATLSSLRTEMDRIQQDRKQAELQLQESETQVQKLWDSLGEQEKLLQKEKEEKASLEYALNEEKNKISRLQAEVKTSDEVQRDFVLLSQKLQ